MMTSSDIPTESPAELVDELADAYEHFYDMVHLRTHPLTDRLVHDRSSNNRKRAREVQSILCELIDYLDPGPDVPPFTHEWRRHQYMVLRYLQGLSHQAVADELGLGLRQYYRVRKAILDEVAETLWQQRFANPPIGTGSSSSPADAPQPTQLEILRLEAAALSQAGRHAQLGEVLEGVLTLLQPAVAKQDITIDLDLPVSPPTVSAQQDLLRQLLLAMIGYLVKRARQGSTVTIAQRDLAVTWMALEIRCSGICAADWDRADGSQQLEELDPMANLCGVEIHPLPTSTYGVGFGVRLPVTQKKVLVVDDNSDILRLFQTYLQPHGYSVFCTQTASDALGMALQFQPSAIFLDVMLPETDGWEVMQELLNHPGTSSIPVIVCTVLAQKELALLLGATAYVAKPVTEEVLVTTLESLNSKVRT